MPASSTILSRFSLGLAGAVGLYAILLGALFSPDVQRFIVYANKVNTLFIHNLDDPQSFGFAKNQVTPFNVQTPDGETLYAWHILPMDVYARNEKRIKAEDPVSSPVADFTQTTAYKFLTSDNPEPARAVVWFHGNAGHVAQNWRPDVYRYFANQRNTHVFTIDYRGFGLSTGSPTEAGVITDGTAFVDWIVSVAKIPPERIVIIGQSLGTAVSSAVGLHFADPSSDLIPSESKELRPLLTKGKMHKPTTFAGIILVAPFSSLASLSLTYQMGGFLPILLPLRPFPAVADFLAAYLIDKWPSAERLTAYYNAVHENPGLFAGSKNRGSLQVIHSLTDADIPYHQTEMICRRMFGQRDAKSEVNSTEIDATDCIDGAQGTGVLDVKRDGWPRVRFEIVGFGGHNRIITYSPVAVALMRAMDDLFE